jgi:hypothetical protein
MSLETFSIFSFWETYADKTHATSWFTIGISKIIQFKKSLSSPIQIKGHRVRNWLHICNECCISTLFCLCTGAISSRWFRESPGQHRVRAGTGPRTRVCAAQLSPGTPPLCAACQRHTSQWPSVPDPASRDCPQTGSGIHQTWSSKSES